MRRRRWWERPLWLLPIVALAITVDHVHSVSLAIVAIYTANLIGWFEGGAR